jgi:hypothetical protein
VNRYTFISRLTGPAMLLLTGVLALLSQAHILPWHKSWPFYLITLGVLKLAQRAALSQMGPELYPGYPVAPPPATGAPVAGSSSTSIVPSSGPGSDASDWRQ